MTDSMKFGPEWLRNMSAEPSGGSTSTTYSVNAASGVNSSGTPATASRNFLFPEYRYGREEMLSLFDRNCLLPQILPSFKKLFVEKVQYPLALTPSSEEDNNPNPVGNSSRPAWLQRSSGGFGTSSRGTGRGGVVDRGRMRGKSVYHPIYQRPSGIYDENSTITSPMNIKQPAERNWIDRNGTGDSAITNNTSTTTSGVGSGGGGGILDWNGTPSSSPRKEFAGHHHRNSNMENWRRTRNEDGSGDGPVVAGSGSEIAAGWRSGGSGGGGNTNNSFGANSHRWGRSTSWRDDESNIDSQQTNIVMQRSISTVGTVNNDRERKQSGIGTVNTSIRVSTPGVKNSQMWTAVEAAVNDDNLPEWAMENPSEVGGSFDASGAFHGTDHDHNDVSIIKSTPIKSTLKDYDVEIETKVIKDQSSDKESEKGKETSTNDVQVKKKGNDDSCDVPHIDPKIMHGNDISDRIKDQVEKLIMDDDNNLSSGNNQRFAAAELIMELNLINENATSNDELAPTSLHQNAPFSDQINLHHLQRHQQHLQPQTPQHFSLLPPGPSLHQHHHSNLMNSNLNDLWFYRDPQTNVQGPFSALEMTEWYRAGYFNENLFVRRFADNRFRPLGELIKFCHGNMPFTHSHLLPSPLELEMEGNQKPLLEGGLRGGNQQQLMEGGSLPVGSQQQLLEGGVLPVGNQQQLLPTAATLPTVPLSSTALPILPLLPRKHQNEEPLKANVTAAAEALTLAIKGNLMGNTSQLLSMRFQMLQDQYVQHQEYQILAELTKNECFQRLSAIEREAIVRRKVQLIALPDYLTSLNGFSNILSIINPMAGRDLYNLVAERSKKDQQNVQQRSIVENNLLDANNFILNAQIMQQQPQEQVRTPNLEELPPRNDLDLLNEYNLRMLLRGGSQQPTITGASPQQQLHSSLQNSVEETQILTAQNLMIPMWLPPQSVKPPNSSSQWQKGTLWDVATLEEEQSQQQQQLGIQKEKQQLNSSFTEQKQAEENVNEQGSIEEPHDIVTDVHHEDVTKSLITAAIEPYKTKEHKQQTNNKLNLNVRQQQQKQINDEDQRRREQTEEKRRQKEDRKRQQLEDEKRRAIQEAEERARQMQEEKERQQQIQAQRRKALLGSNNNAQSQSSPVQGNKIDASLKDSENQQQEKSSARLPSTSIAPWSLTRSPNANSTAAPGLAEIQKAERRERRADQQRHQEQLDRQSRANAAAQAEANDVLLKWQSVAPTPIPVMSLAEIQAEEAKRLTNELRRDLELQQQQHLGVGSLPGGASGAAPGGGTTMSNIWGNVNKAWSGASPLALSGSSSGLWDETSSNHHPASYYGGGSSSAASTTKSSSILQAQNKSITNPLSSPRNLRKSQTLPAINNSGKATIKLQNQTEKVKLKQKTVTASIEEKDKDRKPQFKGQADPSISKVTEYENEFTSWCMKSLDTMAAKVDVPTFVAFLQDLEAPYEVKDYVRIYLGEGKDSLDFAKQFLERRSKYKSLQRAQNAHNDDMCKPAPAITPSSNDNADNKNKQKKVKKNKMTRMDARSILGFSVTAAEGRINVGVRDYVDGP